MLALADRSQSADAPQKGKARQSLFPIGQTPCTPDNKIDFDGLAAEVKFCNRGGVHGFVWPQIASGWAGLTQKERMDGAEAVLAAHQRRQNGTCDRSADDHRRTKRRDRIREASGDNTTHFDALSHFIFNGHIYNGFPASTITNWGAEKDDVVAFKDGLVTRGVLLDWPLFKNVPYMGDDEAISAQDLDKWEKKMGVKIESGDCVLLRTGRRKRVAEEGPLNLNVVAPVGTPLFDNCDLEAAAGQAARLRHSTFLMTVVPLRVPGTTGSPFNPLAIF